MHIKTKGVFPLKGTWSHGQRINNCFTVSSTVKEKWENLTEEILGETVAQRSKNERRILFAH